MDPRAAIRARVVTHCIITFMMMCLPSAYLSQQKSELPAHGTDDGQVLITVSVIDEKGRAAANLPKEAFGVFEDDKEREITSFQQQDIPLSVGFVFDVSGSMFTTNIRRVALVKEKILHFIKQSNPSNEYLLVSFSKQAQLLNDLTRELATIATSLEQLQRPKQDEGTALFDACYLAVEKLKRGSNPKKVLLLVSDGQENNSKYKLRDIVRALKESDIIVYSIVMSDNADIFLGFGQDVLKEISRVSGGTLYYVGSQGVRSSPEITEMFEWIALDLRHQYSIGFKPKAFDGKWHSIRVKIAPIVTQDKANPDSKPKKLRLEARTRQGYYAVRQSDGSSVRKN